MADLKPVYRAVSKEAAETALDELEAKWGQQYPVVLQSWRRKWENLSHYFRYPAGIRKVIYTTNAIESLNSGYRRLNKQRSVFPSDTALLKALYLATHEIAKKWTMPLRGWGRVLGELEIMYPDRLS